MPTKIEEWTPGMRKAWAETWEMPHMKLGLEVLKEMLRPKPLPIVPGQEALMLAAGAYHNSVGRQDVFDALETMGRITAPRRDMPKPWSSEALEGLVESTPKE